MTSSAIQSFYRVPRASSFLWTGFRTLSILQTTLSLDDPSPQTIYKFLNVSKKSKPSWMSGTIRSMYLLVVWMLAL